jgi:hypothetical protein
MARRDIPTSYGSDRTSRLRIDVVTNLLGKQTAGASQFRTAGVEVCSDTQILFAANEYQKSDKSLSYQKTRACLLGQRVE